MSDTIENRLVALLRKLATLPLLRTPEDIKLTPPAVALLTWVSRSPGCGVQDIAKGLNLSPPTISVGIRRLVRGGWLERRTDPNDLRARPIFLTPEGDHLVKRIREHRTDMLSFFLSGLAADEQEQLISLLEQAMTEMERKLDAEQSFNK